MYTVSWSAKHGAGTCRRSFTSYAGARLFALRLIDKMGRVHVDITYDRNLENYTA